MLTRRLWSYRAEIAFWVLWLSAVAGFAALAVWADHRYTLPLDRRVTFGVQELYRIRGATTFFDEVNRTASRGVITVVLLAAFGVLVLRGLRYEALMIAGTGAVRYLQLGVRELVERPKDEFLILRSAYAGLDRPRFYPGPEGFPSGHVFGATIVYGLIFAYAPRALSYRPLVALVRAFCVFEIALIGPARMYDGAHWFSDVYGAILLAGIYLALAWKLDGVITDIRAAGDERVLASEACLSGEQPTAVTARSSRRTARVGEAARERWSTLRR